MAIVEVPLSATPQRFQVALGGIQYQLTLKWNVFDSNWFMDIADSLGNNIACGLPLVTGADLLAQLEYLGVDGELRVGSDQDIDAIPTFDNLGSNSHLYFIQ